MSESLHANRVKQCETMLTTLRGKFESATKKVGKLEGDLGQLEKQLRSKKSASTRDSHLRRTDRKRVDLRKAKEAASKLALEVSTAETKLNEAQSKLADARAAAENGRQRKKDSARKKREREEAAEARRQQRQDRAQARSVEEHAAHEARRIDVLQAQTGELAVKVVAAERRAAPPEITVLFLGSSPADQAELRLDQETREIQKRLRATEYRDSIWFEWRLARQMTDLIEDLNEVDPAILHFSGHSDEDALVFEGDDGLTRELTRDLVSKLLAAAGRGVRLALFNGCHSAALADAACANVDVAIGMRTTIRDDIAKTFAGQFYNSLGFGKSIAEAFRQAVLQLELQHGHGQDIPDLYAADGVDPEGVVLVNPHGACAITAATNEITDLNQDADRWLRDRGRELQGALRAKTEELNAKNLLYSGAFLRSYAALKRQALHEYRDEMTRKRRRYRDLRASAGPGSGFPPLRLTDEGRGILARWRAPVTPVSGDGSLEVEDPTSEVLEEDLRRFEIEGIRATRVRTPEDSMAALRMEERHFRVGS